MIIIGSKALDKIYPSLKREVRDIDIIGSSKELDYLMGLLSPKEIIKTSNLVSLRSIDQNDSFDRNNVEFFISDDSESLRGYCTHEGDKEGEIKFASPEVLFSLKKSHIHFPIKFHKHIKDYVFLNDKLKVDLIPELTKLNYLSTEKRIGELKTPSLNKSVKDFFGQSKDYVKSFFKHDDIHLAVAHQARPLYEKMQDDLNMVKCSRKLWEEFSFEEKCQCVLEEAYVISLERRILPMIFGGGKYSDQKSSLEWAMMRICTTLCSGWFREFATNNYYSILDRHDPKYVDRFLHKYKSGEIKRLNREATQE